MDAIYIYIIFFMTLCNYVFSYMYLPNVQLHASLRGSPMTSGRTEPSGQSGRGGEGVFVVVQRHFFPNMEVLLEPDEVH